MARYSNKIKAEVIVDSDGGVRSIKRVTDSVTEMERRSQASAARMTKSFDVMKVAVLAVVGATALISKSLIDIASDMEETQGKFDVVFKGLNEQAEDWTQTLQDGYAMSELEAKKYMSSLQDLLVPTGMLREEAGKMSFQMTKMAADLGSFGNFKTADVIRDLQSAIQGGSETMAKYGITVKATDILDEARRMGLIKTNKEITAAHKVQALYNIIMKDGADAIGDMARTHSSYANQVKQFNANMENFKIQLGRYLLPYATEMVTKLNLWYKANKDLIDQKVSEYMGVLTKSVEFLKDNFDLLIKAVYATVAAFGVLLAVKVVTIVSAWAVAVGGLIKAITILRSVGITSLIITLGTLMDLPLELWFARVGAASIAFLSNPYFLGAAAVVAGIAAAYYLLSKNSKEAAVGLWESERAMRASSISKYKNQIAEATSELALLNTTGTLSLEENLAGVGQRVDTLTKRIEDANFQLNLLYNPTMPRSLAGKEKPPAAPAPDNTPPPYNTPPPSFDTGMKDIIHLKNNETQQKKINQAVMDQAKSLQEELNTYKLDSFQKEIYELNKVHDYRTSLGLDSVEEQKMVTSQIDKINEESAAHYKAIADKEAEDRKSSLQKWAEDTQTWADLMTDAVSTATDSISSGLTDAIFNFGDSTKSASEQFKQFASDTLKAIAKMIIQFTILNAIKQGLSSYGFADGGVAEGGIAYANGGIVPGGFKKYASGGVVRQPTLGLIGEGTMDEAVVPLPDGNSIPVTMKGGGNNITVVNNITIDKGAGGSEADKTSFANQIATQLKQEMNQWAMEAQRYGGPLYRGAR